MSTVVALVIADGAAPRDPAQLISEVRPRSRSFFENLWEYMERREVKWLGGLPPVAAVVREVCTSYGGAAVGAGTGAPYVDFRAGAMGCWPRDMRFGCGEPRRLVEAREKPDHVGDMVVDRDAEVFAALVDRRAIHLRGVRDHEPPNRRSVSP